MCRLKARVEEVVEGERKRYEVLLEATILSTPSFHFLGFWILDSSSFTKCIWSISFIHVNILILKYTSVKAGLYYDRIQWSESI